MDQYISRSGTLVAYGIRSLRTTRIMRNDRLPLMGRRDDIRGKNDSEEEGEESPPSLSREQHVLVKPGKGHPTRGRIDQNSRSTSAPLGMDDYGRRKSSGSNTSKKRRPRASCSFAQLVQWTQTI